MNWPDDRPGTYDADKWWDKQNEVWTTTHVIRLGNRVEWLIAISEEGEIYYRNI